ncbi:galactosyldiacylglycerol synthase [Streptomyces sp. NPDC051320]|uniref:MGDG synthase family glycosyltransferase n=1 Tax=Streptomyces sp. NPDC051320 TaxID=3154644 RepID=UPI003440DB07
MSTVPRRFLVLSASMGSGHDAVATELTRRLEAAGNQVARADVLELLPAGIGSGLRAFYRTVICHLPGFYAGLYAAFFRSGGGPRPGSAPLAALAERELLALVGRTRPDVVVPVFHLAAQLTGRLRSRGALAVPSAVVITDFAVHRQWLHPGNDLYLCLTPDLTRQVQQAVRRPAATSGALVAERFLRSAPPDATLTKDGGTEGLCTAAPDRPVVLVSAGAWGAGTHMVRTARLLEAAGYRPVVLCGRNTRLRSKVSRIAGVCATGWVDDMPGLMAGARALIDNAAGQTALQALAAGVPVVGYRPIPGHGEEGVRRMAEHGLTEYARDSWSLIQSLDTLSEPGPAREQRIATGRSLFSADAVQPLTALACRA